jgi:hypothetical protein
MKIKDIKIGMFVVCKRKPYFDESYFGLTWCHDSIIGKKLKVIEIDNKTATVRCKLDNGLDLWYEPDWLSPWEEEQKGLVGYYQGIDVTGLDRDIIARMAENNDDLCSSKIYNMIAKLNRCKQINPKTARLVDKLIRELVDILDLHEHEEKKDNLPLNNQIATLKEENETLKGTIKILQKKLNSNEKNNECISCQYNSGLKTEYPCFNCINNPHFNSITSYAGYEKTCWNCRYRSVEKKNLPCSYCNNHDYWIPLNSISRKFK